LQVLLCTGVTVYDFAPSPNMTSGGNSGGTKKFSRLAIARHILHPLIRYDIIRALPRALVGWDGCPSPFLIPLDPSRRLRHLDPRRLRCLELGPPTFQTKVTPLAVTQSSHQLNPALLSLCQTGDDRWLN